MFTVNDNVRNGSKSINRRAMICLAFLISPLCIGAGTRSDSLKMHLVSDRLVTVGQGQILSLDMGGQTGTRLTVKQYDLSWNPLRDLSLQGSGPVQVSGLVANRNGEILIAGSFSGRLSFGESVLKASGEDDIFYLVLSTDGHALSFKRFGGTRNDHPFAVTLGAFGAFEIQWLLETAPDRPNRFMRTKIGEDGVFMDHLPMPFNRGQLNGVDDPEVVVEDPEG